ncbi:Protein of unknown function [Bacillus cereus]
MGNFV